MTKPMKKPTQTKHYAKPENDVDVVKVKVVRNCLRCGSTFMAPTKFIRLCGCSEASARK